MRLFALFCVFLGGLGQGVVNPKLPELLMDHARLALDSGLSASLMYLGIFGASFFYGRWSDRGHTFRLLAGGLLLYSIVLGLFVVVRGKELFFLLRFFEGLGLSAIYVSADVVLCRASSDSDRGRWLSYYGVALALGLLGGPALVLLAKLSEVLLPLAALTGLLAFASLRLELPAWRGEENVVIRNPGAVVAAVLYGFLEAGLVAVLAAVTVNHFHVSSESVFLCLILCAAAASLFWGVLIDKIGGRATLALVFASYLLAVLSIRLFPVEWLPYAAAGAFGVAAGGIYPAGFAWLVEGRPPSQFGYASGLFTRAYGLGSLFGPLLFGLAVELGALGGFFTLALVVGALGIGACAIQLSKLPAAS